MPERQPLPGLMEIAPSDRVRVTIQAPAEMEPGDGEHAAATVLSFAKGAPVMINGGGGALARLESTG